MKSKRPRGRSVARTNIRAPKPTARDHRRSLDPSLATLALVNRAIDRKAAEKRASRLQAYRAHANAYSLKLTSALGAAAAKPQPVRILAEGDSWFDYPMDRGGIISHLERKLPDHALILNLADSGDSLMQMMGLKQRRELAKRLRGKDPFDALLFSGGGNDLVGDEFCLWLNDFQTGMTAAELINRQSLAGILRVLECGFREIAQLRQGLSPQPKIFVHQYDFLQPSDRGVCGHGPWLKPSLDFRGITDPGLQFEVTKLLLSEFAAMLAYVASTTADFHVVHTQGLLQPAKNHWANEIHPTPAGFDLLAAAFHAELKKHWSSL